MRAEHRLVTKRNPANAVSFDTIVSGEAEALKDTPITVTPPRKAEPVSVEQACLPACLPALFYSLKKFS